MFGGVDLFGGGGGANTKKGAAPRGGLFGDGDEGGSSGAAAAGPAAASASDAMALLFGDKPKTQPVAVRAAAAPTTPSTAVASTAAPRSATAVVSDPFGVGSARKPPPVHAAPGVPAAAPDVGSPVKSAAGGKIAGLQAGLQFNPAMLMGGPRPTPKAAPAPGEISIWLFWVL